ENRDFTSVLTSTVVNNGAVRQLEDYALTLDVAKHVAMMSGTEKGFNVVNLANVQDNTSSKLKKHGIAQK
ncbi:hypothetical protein HBR34_09515, partial [Staphylococcus aureus]|nr:hypothetical protein [Staphylococcus aureus]